MKTAILAAGCFWGVQFYFDQIPGVKNTLVGYTGGSADAPTYEMVCNGNTGHAEAVQVVFDEAQVSYDMILRHFFRMHDPSQLNRQGPDVGDQYRSAIFCTDEEQITHAKQIRDELQMATGRTFETQIAPAMEFFVAEDYHQKYAERTGRGVCHVPYSDLDKAAS